MLLRNKEDDCIYDVTSEYSSNGIEIYAIVKASKAGKGKENFYWTYENIQEMFDMWEDIF